MEWQPFSNTHVRGIARVTETGFAEIYEGRTDQQYEAVVERHGRDTRRLLTPSLDRAKAWVATLLDVTPPEPEPEGGPGLDIRQLATSESPLRHQQGDPDELRTPA